MVLKTVNYIKEYGLNKLIDDFNLKLVEYDKKVLIKYNQIDSDMSQDIVQECRGLILEKGTWDIMSFPFKKFFNEQEGNAPKINWDDFIILDKVDGSFIHLYWDWHVSEWVCATTGAAEAEGTVNNRIGFTFKELFWETVENKYPTFDVDTLLDKDRVYMFELTSPYNTVVKQHVEPALTLLGTRNLKTFVESDYEGTRMVSDIIGVPIVKKFDLSLKNAAELKETFDGMPYYEEGYVVMDSNMNRVKIKNPSYVAVHHLKDRLNSYNIMEIIKTNEVDEFNATFPERTIEVLMLKDRYDLLFQLLSDTWKVLKEFVPNDYEDKSQIKTYAAKVFEVCGGDLRVKGHTGLFFGLGNGNTETIREYVKDINNRILYNDLKSEKWNTKE